MEEEVKKPSTRGRKPKEKIEESSLAKLEKEKQEMAEMLANMKEQMESLKEQLNQPQIVVNNQQNSDLSRAIKVTSLLPNVYVLPIDGKKDTYTFTKFGQSILIPFTDMQKIISLYLNQFEKGYAVLSSQKDYDDLQIGYVYEKVLSKDKLERIVKLEDDESIDIILGMDSDMQEKIVGMIAHNIVNGESYDYNMIKKLEDGGLEVNEMVNLINKNK